MAEDKKDRLTLTDDDMVTSPKISRRVLLAGAGVALGAVALGSRSSVAGEADKDGDHDDGEDKDKGDEGEDKDKGGAEDKDKGDDGEDKDKGGAEDKDKGEGERDAD